MPVINSELKVYFFSVKTKYKTYHTSDDSLVPSQEVREGGVGVVEHEVVLGAGQALEVDGGGSRRHGVVGRGRAVRRPVVQPVAAALALRALAAARAAQARARDLDH